MLADEPEHVILSVASELGIDHDFLGLPSVSMGDSRFWLPGHFRLFISHLSRDKEKASNLQKIMRYYGISCFVAHEDIEPTKEWQIEIEKALFSMDAMVAILTTEFRDSDWTDQETGVAVGRGCLVVPLRHGIDPYGLIAKYQGLQTLNRSVQHVGNDLFEILVRNHRTKRRMSDVLVDLLLTTSDGHDARQWLDRIRRVPDIDKQNLERLQEGARLNDNLTSAEGVISSINDLLAEHGLPPTAVTVSDESVFDDDIPF